MATALVFGIDPEREASATALTNFLDARAIAQSCETMPRRLHWGRGSRQKLGVNVGDHITVIVPDQRIRIRGNVQPHIARFTSRV